MADLLEDPELLDGIGEYELADLARARARGVTVSPPPPATEPMGATGLRGWLSALGIWARIVGLGG